MSETYGTLTTTGTLVNTGTVSFSVGTSFPTLDTVQALARELRLVLFARRELQKLGIVIPDGYLSEAEAKRKLDRAVIDYKSFVVKSHRAAAKSASYTRAERKRMEEIAAQYEADIEGK